MVMYLEQTLSLYENPKIGDIVKNIGCMTILDDFIDIPPSGTWADLRFKLCHYHGDCQSAMIMLINFINKNQNEIKFKFAEYGSIFFATPNSSISYLSSRVPFGCCRKVITFEVFERHPITNKLTETHTTTTKFIKLLHAVQFIISENKREQWQEEKLSGKEFDIWFKNQKQIHLSKKEKLQMEMRELNEKGKYLKHKYTKRKYLTEEEEKEFGKKEMLDKQKDRLARHEEIKEKLKQNFSKDESEDENESEDDNENESEEVKDKLAQLQAMKEELNKGFRKHYGKDFEDDEEEDEEDEVHSFDNWRDAGIKIIFDRNEGWTIESASKWAGDKNVPALKITVSMFSITIKLREISYSCCYETIKIEGKKGITMVVEN